MSRAVYPYELGDPDFSWLLATFQDSHPEYVLFDSSCLPLVLIEIKAPIAQTGTALPPPIPESEDGESEKGVLEKS